MGVRHGGEILFNFYPFSVLVFFSISIHWEHICILNARLGGAIDQQNVIIHKACSVFDSLFVTCNDVLYVQSYLFSRFESCSFYHCHSDVVGHTGTLLL